MSAKLHIFFIKTSYISKKTCNFASEKDDSLTMQVSPIAYFRSPLTGKFGIPRQSGIADALVGEIVLCPEYGGSDAVRGLADFDYIWLIWEFSENVNARKHTTVRPPRLGGNRYMGVFATRSPFRPNNIGLSSVRLLSVEHDTAEGTILKVAGADLMNGTPILDIKPYVAFTDSHPDARCGFVDTEQWQTLKVEMTQEAETMLTAEDAEVLREILAQDPRPQYHDSKERVYGMDYRNMNIRFTVDGEVLTVVGVEQKEQ